MDKDIAPGLINSVNEAFEKNCIKDPAMKSLARKLEKGEAGYEDAYKYAVSVGNARAKAFKSEVSSDVLPDGRMYYNIADRLMEDSLITDHNMVADYAEQVQKVINDNAGINLKAQRADADQDRIRGFVERLSDEENYDNVAWILDEPVKVHAMSVVDDTIKKNAEFQNKAGIRAAVSRDTVADCCPWCKDLAGDYIYPNVPKDVFARHDNCRCILEYQGKKLSAYGGGKGHSFRDSGEKEKVEERKQYAIEKLEKIGENRYDKLTEAFKQSLNISEAEAFIKQYVDDTQFGALGVSYKGIGLDVANEINKAFSSFYDTYNVDKFGGIIAPARNTKYGKQIEGSYAGYIRVRNSFLINREDLKSVSHLEKLIAEENKAVANYLKNPNSIDTGKLSKRALDVLNNSRVSGRAKVAETVEDVINHELGHMIETSIYKSENYVTIAENMSKYAPHISGYAHDTMGEYIAESFCSYRKGESVIDPELKKAFIALEKTL